MAPRVEHELHHRKASLNVGLGLVLLAFVGLVYGLTIAKVGTDPTDDLGADWATSQSAASANDAKGAQSATEPEAAE